MVGRLTVELERMNEVRKEVGMAYFTAVLRDASCILLA
jgi:hypothetical protein